MSGRSTKRTFQLPLLSATVWTFAGTPIKSLLFPAGSVEMVGVKRVDNRPRRRRSAISRKPGSRLQSQNSGDAFKNTRSAQPRSSCPVRRDLIAGHAIFTRASVACPKTFIVGKLPAKLWTREKRGGQFRPGFWAGLAAEGFRASFDCIPSIPSAQDAAVSANSRNTSASLFPDLFSP